MSAEKIQQRQKVIRKTGEWNRSLIMTTELLREEDAYIFRERTVRLIKKPEHVAPVFCECKRLFVVIVIVKVIVVIIVIFVLIISAGS